MDTPRCWICGDVADSAEHMVKASDFRSVFGKVSQQSPVYQHSQVQRNAPIKGVNASPLKFRPSLCRPCNNARTQPHDRAWEALVLAVRQHEPPLRSASLLPIAQAFRGQARQEMLNVHLYFLKQLGCHSVEHGVPLPVSTFAVAIVSGQAHPNVYLDFVSVLSNAGVAEVVVGNINAVNRGARTVAATWFYVVGSFGVHLTYWESGHPRPTPRLGWHPSDVGLKLRMR